MSWIIYGAIAYAAYKLATKTSAPPKKKKKKRPRAEDPRRVLGVAPEASEAEIRRAYQEQIRIYHPDRVAGAAPELQRLAEERTKQINRAYAELMGRAEPASSP